MMNMQNALTLLVAMSVTVLVDTGNSIMALIYAKVSVMLE